MTESLVRKQQAGVWRYLRFLGCAVAAADDLTQETFLILLRAEPEDRGPSMTAAWLRGVARNLVREQRRKLRDGLERLEDHEIELAYERYARRDDGNAYHSALALCMEQLGPTERQALVLRYRDGASRESIADTLSIGGEGAKSVLRRAKNKLRLCIQGRLGDE